MLQSINQFRAAICAARNSVTAEFRGRSYALASDGHAYSVSFFN